MLIVHGKVAQVYHTEVGQAFLPVRRGALLPQRGQKEICHLSFLIFHFAGS